jgi:HEAT repeat protein
MDTRNGTWLWQLSWVVLALVLGAVAGCGSPAPAPPQQPGGAIAPPPAAAPAGPVPAAPGAPPPGAGPAAPSTPAPPGAAPGAPGTESRLAVRFPEAGGATAPKEQLLAQWMEMAKSASREKPNIDEGAAIARQLATYGADALAPLYDVLADRASTPFAKALVTMSVSNVVDPKEGPRLLAMVKPENDPTTRTCATSLLAAVPGPEVDTALNELKTDTDRQVRFQALRALATRNPEGRKALADLWKLPDTTPEERASIVNVLSVGPAADSLGVFQDAVRDPTIHEQARELATQLLGRVGNASSIAALTECAEKDPSERVRNTAKTAIEAINTRMKQSAQPSS